MTGFDVYTRLEPAVGDTASFRVWSYRDNGSWIGGLGDEMLEIRTLLTKVDIDGAIGRPMVYRSHADFDPVALTAGRYWMSLSGGTSDDYLDIGAIGLAAVHGGDGVSMLFYKDGVYGPYPTGDIALRVWGELAESVPDEGKFEHVMIVTVLTLIIGHRWSRRSARAL